MATSYYSTGTVSLTNGSAVVTGNGTGWQLALISGGNVMVQAPGNVLPIASVNSDTQITSELQWTGATGEYAYTIQRDTAYLQSLDQNSQNLSYLLSELRAGTIFKYDQSGDLAGRDLYDARPKNFGYLVTIGVSQPVFYVKASNTDGDWAGPFPYGTGPQGPQGPVGTLNPRGTYSAATLYEPNDNVLYNGSSFVALQATTGNAPPTLPATENAYWSLLAAKGQDGLGTGDVVGPASSENNHIAAFDGTTGKLLKDGGATVSSLLPKAGGVMTGPIQDAVFAPSAAPTKKASINTAAVTAGQTRQIVMPDRDVDLSSVGAGWELVGGAPVDLAGQAQASWTASLSVYERVLLIASGVPSGGTGNLFCRFSRDGTAFDAGASDYSRALFGVEGTGFGGVVAASASMINLSGATVAANVFKVELEVSEFNKAGASVFEGETISFSGSGLRLDLPYGFHNFVGALQGLRFGITAGTFTRGKAYLFGLRG